LDVGIVFAVYNPRHKQCCQLAEIFATKHKSGKRSVRADKSAVDNIFQFGHTQKNGRKEAEILTGLGFFTKMVDYSIKIVILSTN
jgi:hypothetical protein